MPVVLLGICCTVAHAGPATVLMPASLHARPMQQAPVAAAVPAGASVEILRSKGFWVEVRTKQGSGWIKLSHLNLPEDTIMGATSPLFGVASGRVVAEPGP